MTDPMRQFINKQRAMARAFKGGTLTRKQRIAQLVRAARRASQ